MPSLSELEASPPVSRPEKDVTVVLDIPLVRRVNALTAEMTSLYGSKSAKDRALYSDAKAELESLDAEIKAKSGTLLLRATLSLGQWNNFTDENPARPEGTAGWERDRELTGGRVNADALLNILDQFAVQWDGEDLAPAVRDAKGEVVKESQFDRVLLEAIPPGTIREMLAGIVDMYLESPDFSKWLAGFNQNAAWLRESDEPATSESPRSDSTAGNPEPSSEESTETETPAP